MGLIPLALRANAGHDFFIIEVSRSHTHTHTHTHNDAPQSVGLFWTNDQLVAKTSTWQHTTLTRDRHPCPQRNSNTQNLSRWEATGTSHCWSTISKFAGCCRCTLTVLYKYAYSYVVQGVGLTNGTPPVGNPTKFMSVDLFLIIQAWCMPDLFRLFYSLLSHKYSLHLVCQNGSLIVYKPCLPSL